MARIRTIKPNHVNDKELCKISLQAHLLWILMWPFSDDEGVIENDPLLIKSQLFPRRTDVRIEQIEQWLDQLVKARFIIPFTFQGEGYYLHRTFKVHQKIDRPQGSKIDSEVIRRILDEYSSNDNRTLVDDSSLYSIVKEGKVKEINTTNVVSATKLPAHQLPKVFKDDLKAEWAQLTDEINKSTDIRSQKLILQKFIVLKKPQFIEPYATAWNMMATENGFSTINMNGLSSKRVNQLKTRLKESSFDFMRIMWSIPRNPNYKESIGENGWTVNFDYVIKNDTNYLKIIEGVPNRDAYDVMIQKMLG